MTTPERHDELIQTLGELGKMAVPVEDHQRAEYRRERIVRLLGTSITSERRRARRAHLWPWLYVAAAGVLAVGGAVGWSAWRAPAVVTASAEPNAGEARSVAGDVTVRRGEQTSPLRVGDVLVGGEVLATAAQAVAEIGIDAGRAELEGSSELLLVRPTAKERRLRLGVGTVDVDLPRKLAAGKHLVVETPDVEVLVVGTAFTVDVDRTGAASTRVRVRRGTVWIMQGGKQRAVLNAGDDWSSATLARSAVPVATEVAAVAPVKQGPARGSSRLGAAKRSSDRGTLEEENRLFQAGLSARNAGDHGGAAEAFAGLLSRYPRSVLREQALAEQFRALERAGRTSAATVAARRYLAGYPSGFARADAERVTSRLLPER
jgi:hypothetical protein